jgi:hypothetical protein
VTISTRFLVCAKKRNRDAIWKETQFLLIDICFFFFFGQMWCAISWKNVWDVGFHRSFCPAVSPVF